MSLWLSVSGGVLLTGAAIFLVSVSLGTVVSTTQVDGAMVHTSRPTASIVQDSPTAAFGWIAAALAVAVVATLLIRYGGGVVGAGLVAAVMGIVPLAAILTIGIYLLPGAFCFGGAALLTIVDRLASPD